MFKKLAIGIVGVGLLVGAGTAVFADKDTTENYNDIESYQNENNNQNNSYTGSNYEDMKPHMKRMHPEMSDEAINQMYNDCHGSSKNRHMNYNNQTY
ncbi:hypothetical protein [Bacillus massiliigorillae]|uniref:hypothetical protein n=1 Tax=Bacillus massiliigorillae TaxID=1243664 RepID=UPI0003A406EC|nr:hypothetical protein [Bacillus massiliigorillae]